MENLRLKARETTLNPPGISLLRAPSPEEAARQMREAFPAAEGLHEAAQVIGSTTVEKIRQAGFDVLPNPTKKLPNHYRIIHPEGVAGFHDVSQPRPALSGIHRDVRTRRMISQRVTLIDAGRQVVATAQVAEQGSHFVGQIDLGLMPVPLQQLFTEYEEIVSTHIFSLLDAIEEKIETLHLKAMFEDGHEAVLTDVQIYPSTKKVSFQVVQGGVSHTRSA